MNGTSTISLRQKKLHFAKEFGWTDQRSVPDAESEGLKSLHSRNRTDIPLCNCRRCIRWKHIKRIDEKRNQLGRNLDHIEMSAAHDEVMNETDVARRRAGL